MTYLVEFKNGRWGFTILKGDKVVTDTWSANGFPMATDPDSEWQKSEVEKVAEVTRVDAERMWALLDSMVAS